MNLSLLNYGYPMLNIKKEMRAEYFLALNQYGENKDLNPFIKFMETAIIVRLVMLFSLIVYSQCNLLF